MLINNNSNRPFKKYEKNNQNLNKQMFKSTSFGLYSTLVLKK